MEVLPFKFWSLQGLFLFHLCSCILLSPLLWVCWTHLCGKKKKRQTPQSYSCTSLGSGHTGAHHAQRWTVCLVFPSTWATLSCFTPLFCVMTASFAVISVCLEKRFGRGFCSCHQLPLWQLLRDQSELSEVTSSYPKILGAIEALILSLVSPALVFLVFCCCSCLAIHTALANTRR